MEVADVLERAADLIEPEGAWTQGSFARTVTGFPVGFDTPAAKCFCTRGAIMRVQNRGVYDSPAETFFSNKVTRSTDGYVALRLVNWNDAPERTQSEVVAKLREAAALARAKGV